MNEYLTVRAFQQMGYIDEIQLFAKIRDPERRYVGRPTGPIVFEELPEQDDGMEGNFDTGLRLTQPNAQTLMNDLWNMGIRPNDAADKTETVKVMQSHLDDMRRLVETATGTKLI